MKTYLNRCKESTYKNTFYHDKSAQYKAYRSKFVTLGTITRQAPLSMGFSKQEYWRGLPFPSPGDPPNPGVEPRSPASSALAGEFFIAEPPGKPLT